MLPGYGCSRTVPKPILITSTETWAWTVTETVAVTRSWVVGSFDLVDVVVTVYKEALDLALALASAVSALASSSSTCAFVCTFLFDYG